MEHHLGVGRCSKKRCPAWSSQRARRPEACCFKLTPEQCLIAGELGEVFSWPVRSAEVRAAAWIKLFDESGTIQPDDSEPLKDDEVGKCLTQ